MLDYLRTITERKSLSFNEMKLAAEQLFSEEITDIERGAFLSALRVKGETPEEIAGLAAAIQAKSLQLPVDSPDIIDNCGTGGDGSMSFNISTTAAFVMAGAGLTVAKHGNRSVSSKTGSADVLEELGVNLSLSGHHAKELLEQNGITFLFAPTIHPGDEKADDSSKDFTNSDGHESYWPIDQPSITFFSISGNQPRGYGHGYG